MVAKLAKWGARLFPERQILIRTEGRISYLTLTRRAQVAAATGALLGVVVFGVLVARYVHYGHVISAKQAQVAKAELSNQELRHQLAELQAQVAMASAEIDGTQYRLDVIGSEYGTLQGSLSDTEQALKGVADARAQLIAERDDLLSQLQSAQDDANSKADIAAQLAQNLARNKTELSQTEAQRRTLNARIQQLEKDVQASNDRAAAFKTAFDNTQAKLQQISSEREHLMAERERLAAERDALKQKLQSVEARISKVDTKTSESVAALPAPTREKADGVFGSLESMVAATGLNVENFIARLGGPAKSEGGPYIALGGPKQLSAQDQTAREETLRKLLKTLPLAAPLGQYQLESPFGSRVDPINHRQGFHPGVDLAAAFRSPVYSTAPGVVTFAGPRDTYGKFVEIDHGNGIVTHYAHLHRISVSRGQRVGAHQEVGELGSTGRSTGPHLHYEVVVDGEPLDPEKFLQVGKSVVQVKRN
ncbi:MAG TPA: peptidoglycan DD-metalloendopeptidase family protein [Stellaceae bacterium]|nr:peptidoglycan DD-metalloendopeptidase family protein [Stellaceae bacterium]